MTIDIIEKVLEEVYFPTGTEYSWEVDYDYDYDHDVALRLTFETFAGHVQDVVEHLRHNYPQELASVNRLTEALQDGYNQWREDGSPDPEEDFDHRYDVAVSHLVEEADDGWIIRMHTSYGWWDVWQSLGELYVPLDMTEAELRKAIADTLGSAWSFLHPRQLEDDHE